MCFYQELDGWEILRSLRADILTNTIPVVICSAWYDADTAQLLGANDFIKKPITLKPFLETIHHWI